MADSAYRPVDMFPFPTFRVKTDVRKTLGILGKTWKNHWENHPNGLLKDHARFPYRFQKLVIKIGCER